MPSSFCDKKVLNFIIMSSFVYTLIGLTAGLSLHCAVRREISPCTCRRSEQRLDTIFVTCERMESFDQVVGALQDRFTPDDNIVLKITYSKLEDLSSRSFQELKMSVTNLKLNHDNLSFLPDSTFIGMGRTQYFSLADNFLPAVPVQILKNMPSLRTLDIGRGKIQALSETDFMAVPNLEHLVLPSNLIKQIDQKTFPRKLHTLHLGRNQLTSLNGTLRELEDLEWLFINDNQLTILDEEMPLNGNKLILIHAANNRLEQLPQTFRTLERLESLFFQHNTLVTLNGALQKSKHLKRLQVSHNKLSTISEDEFLEAESLEDLQLGYNMLTTLNGSLLPCRSLRTLNLTHNDLREFSMQEVKDLRKLRIVDLSNNRLERLSGQMENLVELETRIIELRLEHNNLISLDGALMNLHGLARLNISHNLIQKISPDDLIGLEDLKVLDVSHNRLVTLEETAKTFLPSLEELLASYNLLQVLERDFHGLPQLCWADLSHNEIRAISKELVAHTRCTIHGVPGMLKINLQDNPVLCDERLPGIIASMESQHARIHGVAQCFVAPPPPPIVPLGLAKIYADAPKVVAIATDAII